MYAVNNNNIGTCTSYLSFVTETWFYTFYDPVWEIADCGVQLFCSGFSSLRKWTFGAGYNHPAVVLQPFILTWTTSPCYSNLFNVSWVGTDNKGQLKAVVRAQKY